MWNPSTWDEIETAVSNALPEAHDLDFKEQLSNNRELAKDVCAMTVHGGTVVIGVAEDVQGCAAAVKPVRLAGLLERIQQVVDSSIRPSPAIDVAALTQGVGDPDGVVVVSVPPSMAAPHEWEGRFPARSGPTTRYMAEPEIASLYAQRRRFTQSETQGRTPLDGFVPPEGVTSGSGYQGIGRMEILVQPVAPTAHPAGVRLKKPLEEALNRSQTALSRKIASAPRTLGALWDWQPRGASGWKAGTASTDFQELTQAGVLVSATVTYPASLSAYTTMSVDGGQGREAFEHLWVPEAIALLQFAGDFFSGIAGVGLLRAELRLANLDGCVSSVALHKLKKTSSAIADNPYVEARLFSPRELVVDAPGCAMNLMERLLVSFVPPEINVLAESGVAI